MAKDRRHFYLDAQTAEKVDELVALSGTPNAVEILRRAVRLLYFFEKEVDLDVGISVQRKDGERQVLTIL